MANTKITDLTELAAMPAADDLLVLVDVSDTTMASSGTDKKIRPLWLPLDYSLCQGRLTLTSGTAVTTSDVTAAGTLYFTPYNGNLVWLYDGSRWVPFRFTERSLALTVTADTNYDVFLYNNAGTLTLELSAAWASATTRTDALTTQDGIPVKSGATTRRHVGTIRASAANVTEDSAAKRFVWNRYQQVPRALRVADATATWTYTTATWRQARASAANQLAYVTGEAGTVVTASVKAEASNASVGTGVGFAAGLGVDIRTTVPAVASGATGFDSKNYSMFATYVGTPGLGYHFLPWLEFSGATNTTTWIGTTSRPAGFLTGSLLG